MNHMTLKEAGEKWGVPPRRMNYYCAAGRTPGVTKMATTWLIPKTVEKPINRRTKKGKVVTEQYNEISAFWIWFRRERRHGTPSRKNYKMMDGRLLRTDKKYSHLK